MFSQIVRRRAFAAAATAVATVSVAGASQAHAASASFTQPDLDRWIYPFSSDAGRSTASVFGAVGQAAFDDRDAQFLVGFNTGAQIPTGLGASNYVITSIKVTAIDSNGGYSYDNTYDNVASYTTAVASDDAGRPLELHGAGFRGAFDHLTFNSADATGFKENSPSASGAGPSKGSKNAFAASYVGGVFQDVSNNIANNFESNPFAIGIAGGNLAAGSAVPVDTTFTFDINLSDPNVLAYFQSALNSGTLGVMIDGVLPATQQSNSGIPQFYNKENAAQRPDLGSFVAPQLQVQYTTVPEPAVAGLLGLLALGLGRRRR